MGGHLSRRPAPAQRCSSGPTEALGTRSSAMPPRATLLLILTVLAGVPCKSASAQILVVTPGSTIEGDLLRGWGIAAFGAGFYNANTALAQAIQAETWMRLNQYAYASRL